MNSNMIKSVLVLAALTQVESTQAIQLVSNEQGIFSKLIQEETEASNLDKELQDAKDRKKQ